MALPRSKTFAPERQPFRHTNTLQLNDKVSGPFSFLNPTQAHFDPLPLRKCSTAPPTPSEEEDADNVKSPSRRHIGKDEFPADNMEFKWTSRNNRKGRHALVVHTSTPANDKYLTPRPTSDFREVVEGIWRMFIEYPYWDISWCVAWGFTIGSWVWVLNGFFALLPFTNPSSSFAGETLYAGGISAFVGATLFEAFSVLLMLEAVNENRAGCFGYAVTQLYEEHVSHEGLPTTRVVASKDECTHHHQNRRNLVGNPKQENLSTVRRNTGVEDLDPTPKGSGSWIWWPSWYELRTHYFRDLGFLACSSQMFGATVFWISGFTALPGIYTSLKTTAQINGAYWVPQVIGGVGFVVSGTLFMIETQQHWWMPAPKVLGWHIGAWNLIGGIGFTLCAVFGLLGTQRWQLEQASVSTFWGSWSFLIGSVIQLYESLDKHPVEKTE